MSSFFADDRRCLDVHAYPVCRSAGMIFRSGGNQQNPWYITSHNLADSYIVQCRDTISALHCMAVFIAPQLREGRGKGRQNLKRATNEFIAMAKKRSVGVGFILHNWKCNFVFPVILWWGQAFCFITKTTVKITKLVSWGYNSARWSLLRPRSVKDKTIRLETQITQEKSYGWSHPQDH